MNVLLLSQFFSTTRGGGEYVFSIIAKKLAEDNKVFVITNKIEGENYIKHKNIQVIFVPPVLQYRGGLPPGFSDNIRYTINAVRQGLKTIKNEKIDIIHSNNFAPALAGSILSSLTSKPHITTVHDIFSLCGKNYWKQWGKQSDISRLNVLVAPLFEKLSIKLRYSCIHTVSEATRDDLIKFGAKKPIHVIHNAVDMTPQNNIPPNPFQFVYIGRLVFYKNLEVVIKAIDIIKNTEPKIKLTIIGSGPHKQTLQKMVQDLKLEKNIQFKGYVDADEKIKTLSESNALVFPSLCEGFGLVILESFDQSRPVLVSDLRPMSDIVSHKQNGLVIDPHDENLWAEHMLHLSKNPSESSEMGRSGNHVLQTKYSQDTLYKKIMEMYQTVVKTRD
ncbi:Glycosyltransferase [Nitrosotalea sinensis]|uniref:Glycosyltransferase n=1 Tax=Nitrosotalea sinensis TaxID=1499975 RepID=A0A2H1EED5_9ARCH|nr:glycosyltransferase family 4 protein [Candidatus Nitrosotalea sinensis]SHO42883.1 Glycosyltransferase [Candidatus Nitrosotalea sinensis]